MAKKSKTQRAKASAARQARKAAAIEEQENPQVETVEEPVEEKKSLFKKSSSSDKKTIEKAPEPKAKPVAKKKHFKFFHDVKAEMKRVTWPTRQDVTRWSLVVVGALVFFGVYVAVLDNLIVSPLLYALSGLGA